MSSCHVLQGVNFVNSHIKFVINHQLPQLVRIVLVFFSSVEVVEECRSGNFGVFCGELSREISVNWSLLLWKITSYEIKNGSTAPLAFPKLATLQIGLVSASRH